MWGISFGGYNANDSAENEISYKKLQQKVKTGLNLISERQVMAITKKRLSDYNIKHIGLLSNKPMYSSIWILWQQHMQDVLNKLLAE